MHSHFITDTGEGGLHDFFVIYLGL